MQEMNNYINLEKNNFLSLFVEPKSIINTTYITHKEKLLLDNISNENRKQEFIQTRKLRNETIGKIEILYNEDGKPLLTNSDYFISISHSQHFIGIFKAPFNIGLDIEEINDRVLKIKQRFLNNEEQILFGTNIENLTVAWTLKEAMFKLNNRTGIDFSTELLIVEKTDFGFLGKMLDIDGWRTVKLKTIRKENLIISYNFEPSILL
jgi:phosphopantetheinyl transferase (holo-ACP synthase)